jgi:hypothetical protein
MVRWWSGWSWVGEPTTPDAAASAHAGRGLRDIGELVNDAWTPIGARLSDLAAMAAAIFLPVLLFGGPLAWLQLRDVELIEHRRPLHLGEASGSASTVEYELVGVGASQVVTIVLVGAAFLLATGLLWLGAARLLAGEQQGVREAWPAALRAGIGRFWRVLGTVAVLALALVGSLVAAILMLAISAAIPVLLLVTIPAAIVGVAYVVLRLQLAPVAAAVGPPGLAAVRHSWDLVGTRMLGVLGRLLVLGLIAAIASSVATYPLSILQAAVPSAPTIGLSVVASTAAQSLATVYLLSGSILVWRDLGGELEPIEPDAPPGGIPPVIGNPIDG